jgi:carboxypeptidase Taq
MTPPAYPRLVAKLKRAHLVGTVSDLLGWDEQVNLPPDSGDQRAAQHSVMAELGHAAATDPEIGRLLTELETGPLAADEQVVVREARREYDRATKLPADFVAEKAVHGSKAYHAWVDARKRNAFDAFAPFLEKHLELAKSQAAYLGHTTPTAAYDHFIDLSDPGMTAATIAALFAELKTGLVPLVRRIAASPVKARRDLLRGCPVEQQGIFLREVTAKLGFDYRRGRIDVSVHPFCSGTGSDTRMTTRFDPDSPLKSLFGSIHETGHGLYEQGQPREHAGTALAQHAGMGVHESQSRLWENQVARGRPFWKFFGPRFRELFPEQTAQVSPEELHLAVNAVQPGLIRVDADEVTYNLHIILRFELEQRLFRGELAVRDLPAAWRTAMRELLGIEPATDREGVLQDIHWSGGAFGYFPSYCLGNMIAAQLWYRALAVLPGLEDDFARGDFSRLLGWLRREVHARGRRLPALELVRTVTGGDLTPKHLLRYLEERYAKLYGVA